MQGCRVVHPMNFPEELIHAAGFLTVVIQENSEPDSEGRVILAEFYCGYTGNLAGQAATGKVRGEMGRIVREVERSAGAPIDQGRLRNSIRLYNEDRSLLRKVFDARRDGRLHLPAKQIQDLVKSSMIMEKA